MSIDDDKTAATEQVPDTTTEPTTTQADKPVAKRKQTAKKTTPVAKAKAKPTAKPPVAKKAAAKKAAPKMSAVKPTTTPKAKKAAAKKAAPVAKTKRKQAASPVAPVQAAVDEPAKATPAPPKPPAAPTVAPTPAPVAVRPARAPQRSASIPAGSVVIANQNGVTDAGRRMVVTRPGAPVSAVVDTPPEVKHCFVRLPVLVNEKLAVEYARKLAYRLGTTVQVWRSTKIEGEKAALVVQYGRGDDETTSMMLGPHERGREKNTPWMPDPYAPQARFTPPPGAVAPTPRAPQSTESGRRQRRSLSGAAPAPGVGAAPQRAPRASTRVADADRPSSRCIQLMLRPNGATVDEMKAITGWGFGRSYVERLARTHRMVLHDVGDKHYRMTRPAA